ncbi:MAG: endonuclease NucS domain-containing protein [bacterium]
MPVEIGFWKLSDNTVERIDFTTIQTEKKLEDVLEEDISILSEDILLIGRQILTSYGKYIDMLAIDIEGNILIIELKKNKTSRDVVAQTLDYASWVQELSYEDIVTIYSEKIMDKS